MYYMFSLSHVFVSNKIPISEYIYLEVKFVVFVLFDSDPVSF